MMKTVITYGTFDIFHVGHLRMLERLSKLGDRLIVGVSTDEFNEKKNKVSLLSFEDRAEVVRAVRYVDLVIPEESWEQKEEDIRKFSVDVFGIGDDWAGKFDHLKEYCEIVYLPRTFGISSTKVKQITGELSLAHIQQIENSAREIANILKTFGISDKN
jgi:glycerol-3-phosphate cytidylyltransferase